MSETTFHQLKMTEDHTARIDGETRELGEDELLSATSQIANMLVNKAGVATYTGKKQAVEDADTRITATSKLNVKEADEDYGEDFDYEEYVDEHTAKEVIEAVEDANIVTWLENLANYDDRKTVQKAINDRLEELEE